MIKAELYAGALLGVVALATLIYARAKLPAAVEKLGAAINPLNKDNVFYSGVNDLGAAVSSDTNFNLGARVWEWTHPGAMDAERAAFGSSAPAPEQSEYRSPDQYFLWGAAGA